MKKYSIEHIELKLGLLESVIGTFTGTFYRDRRQKKIFSKNFKKGIDKPVRLLYYGIVPMRYAHIAFTARQWKKEV
jgi:hypothetical protein